VIPNNCPDKPFLNSPDNGDVDLLLSVSLSADVADVDGDALVVTFFDASDDSVINVDSSIVGSGNASVVWNNLVNDQSYSWYVRSNDGSCDSVDSATWSFSTTSAPNNCPDKPIKPIPSNESTDQPTTVTLGVYVKDIDGDALDVTFVDASDDSIIGVANIVGSGNVTTTWSGLANSQIYYWYAISSDGSLNNISS